MKVSFYVRTQQSHKRFEYTGTPDAVGGYLVAALDHMGDDQSLTDLLIEGAAT